MCIVLPSRFLAYHWPLQFRYRRKVFTMVHLQGFYGSDSLGQRKAISTTSEQLQRVRDMVHHLSETCNEISNLARQLDGAAPQVLEKSTNQLPAPPDPVSMMWKSQRWQRPAGFPNDLRHSQNYELSTFFWDLTIDYTYISCQLSDFGTRWLWDLGREMISVTKTFLQIPSLESQRYGLSFSW